MQTSAIKLIWAALLCGLSVFSGWSQTSITLNLINADSNTVIQVLHDGDTLDLSLLPTTNLNIEGTANTSVGSIDFDLINHQQKCESTAPYALFGDSGGNFNSWTPTGGSYTVDANAYSGACGNKGSLLADTTIGFFVYDPGTPDCNGDAGGNCLCG